MATTPNRRKRPSRASVARLRAEFEARPHHRELSEALGAVIDDYRSARVSDATMEKIKPFLRAAVTASTLAGAESVRKHCNHLSQLAVFAIERGRPLSIEALLTTTFIDEYVRVGMAEADDHLRAERRRRLLSVARAANPGPDVPAKLTPIRHSSIKPCYIPAELAVIVRACQVQPTAARQRDLAIVVALAAGAGLDSVDMRDEPKNHIEDLAEDGIRVHVQGPRPRIVILRAGFESLLRAAISGIPADELLLGRKQDRRNTAARAVERAALHNVPAHRARSAARDLVGRPDDRPHPARGDPAGGRAQVRPHAQRAAPAPGSLAGAQEPHSGRDHHPRSAAGRDPMSAKRLTRPMVERTVHMVDNSGVLDILAPPTPKGQRGRKGQIRANTRLLAIGVILCTRLGHETTVAGVHGVLTEAFPGTCSGSSAYCDRSPRRPPSPAASTPSRPA